MELKGYKVNSKNPDAKKIQNITYTYITKVYDSNGRTFAVELQETVDGDKPSNLHVNSSVDVFFDEKTQKTN